MRKYMRQWDKGGVMKRENERQCYAGGRPAMAGIATVEGR